LKKGRPFRHADIKSIVDLVGEIPEAQES